MGGLESRVWGLGFRVYGLWFRGLGFRVSVECIEEVSNRVIQWGFWFLWF